MKHLLISVEHGCWLERRYIKMNRTQFPRKPDHILKLQYSVLSAKLGAH